MKRKIFLAVLTLIAGLSCLEIGAKQRSDKGYKHILDISYLSKDETDAYKKERCKLDIYYPEKVEGYATLVWFHGGGLEGGNKHLLNEFRQKGFAVVDVNYRLSPKVTSPAYIEDAAQAVAWVMNNISEYGGDPHKIYIGGHSAGGYLTLMLMLDNQYFEKFGANSSNIVRAYPVSGQTVTHYTIRKERGMPKDIPWLDEMAPCYHASTPSAPIILITGDRKLEMLSRYEENLLLYSLLVHFKRPCEIFEIQGTTHGSVLAPACCIIRDGIRKDNKEDKK